ncbi:hypothetical protein HK097_000773, partial [Rhizophlyctis rosea]
MSSPNKHEDSPGSTARRSRRGQQTAMNNKEDAAVVAMQKTLDFVRSQVDKTGRLLSEMFEELPDPNEYPSYYEIIRQPMALGTMQRKLESNQYVIPTFRSDFNLMIENAMVFNHKRSLVYRDALTLRELFEETLDRELKSAGLNVPAALPPLAQPPSFTPPLPMPTPSPASRRSQNPNIRQAPETPAQRRPSETPARRRRSETPVQKAQAGPSNDETPNLIYEEIAKVLKKVRTAKSQRGGRLAEVFEELPDKEEYPDYYNEISQPIALDVIQSKVLHRQYKALAEVEADLHLMTSNAMEYNTKGSDVYQDAVDLEAFLEKIFGRGSPRKETNERTELESLSVNGEVHTPGDFVYIANPLSPTQPTICCIQEIWARGSGQQRREGVTVTWYLRPEQTVHKATQRFMEKEVFRTSEKKDYYASEIVGRCHVLYVRDYIRGKLKGAKPEDTYVCENRYDDKAKQYAKVKDWNSGLPRSARGREVDLDLYPSPIVPNKVLSSLAAPG